MTSRKLINKPGNKIIDALDVVKHKESTHKRNKKNMPAKEKIWW